jgi:NAD-dependent SIR2 family protein deacetylase
VSHKSPRNAPVLVECPKCGGAFPEWEFGDWLDSNEPPVCTKCEPQKRLEL